MIFGINARALCIYVCCARARALRWHHHRQRYGRIHIQSMFSLIVDALCDTVRAFNIANPFPESDPAPLLKSVST